MEFSTSCPHCGLLYPQVPADYQGKDARCKRCGKVFRIESLLLQNPPVPTLAAGPAPAPIPATAGDDSRRRTGREGARADGERPKKEMALEPLESEGKSEFELVPKTPDSKPVADQGRASAFDRFMAGTAEEEQPPFVGAGQPIAEEGESVPTEEKIRAAIQILQKHMEGISKKLLQIFDLEKEVPDAVDQLREAEIYVRTANPFTIERAKADFIRTQRWVYSLTSRLENITGELGLLEEKLALIAPRSMLIAYLVGFNPELRAESFEQLKEITDIEKVLREIDIPRLDHKLKEKAILSIRESFKLDKSINKYLAKYPPKATTPTNTVQRTSTQGGCFIATAVYGSERCREVTVLRRFRDHVLLETNGVRGHFE